MSIDFNKLSPEEKNQLRAQLEEEQQSEAQRIQEERETYKTLTEEFITRNYVLLNALSKDMVELKRAIFEDAETLIAMKNGLFKVKGNRQTDTFTSIDGRVSIKLGNRVNEGWDDTVEIGIEKVKQFLETLAKDANSAMLVKTVMGLLAKNHKGALKANKVLELEKLANEAKDPLFLDGIKIIKEAYRPAPTCQFIQVVYKDENNKEHALPLSMSAID